MNDLIQVLKNNAVVSSKAVAEHFGKRHDNLLQAIETQYKHLLEFKEMFWEAVEKDSYERDQKIYYMNRDGFSLLVMGMNGKKALEWKLKYIKAFNAMEKVLSERQTLEWQETRRLGKLTRRSETDVIKDLIEYAKEQGSRNADMLYMTYSKLANKIAGISKRDLASIKQLNALDDVESMILHVIRMGMASSKHYKEIYQDCKRRLEWWQEITFQKLLTT